MSASLEIYVQEGCAACRRSLTLAAAIRARFPQMSVHVVDMASGRGAYRHLVTATPTFVLNGTTFSLGNPSRARLERAIAGLLERSPGHEPTL